MSILNHLTPSSMWMYFEEICKIPRLSKNEVKIREFLLEFARKNRLDSMEDEIGNILIIRPASPGMENRRPVVLQSHMDMVGEKNPGSAHDWNNDPVVPVVKNEWVVSKDTTLGADDGIGVASQLAILSDHELKAGKIECLFTVDEESGMTGAINLKPDFFEARTLINLDSEDEGILFIGCAGGLETSIKIPFVPVAPKINSVTLEIKVNGLHGGHSGDEIHKGYGNSIKILAKVLLKISESFPISLADFSGGNLRNAIPREATSVIVARNSDENDLRIIVENIYSQLRKEFGETEPELSLTIKKAANAGSVLDQDTLAGFLDAINCCPHGALAWSKDMDDLVETSTNLASVKFSQDTINIVTTQRSSIETSKHEASNQVRDCFTMKDAKVIVTNSYPGWKPDLNSEILKLTRKSYVKLFGREPQVRAIHAGLECGLIYEKFKGIDMISFGPTIRGAHTTEEKIEIKTAQMFWNLLKEVVCNMPEG